MPDLLGQLPIKRRLGTVVQLWLEVHSAIPYHIGLSAGGPAYNTSRLLTTTGTAAVKSSFATILISALAQWPERRWRRNPDHDTGPRPNAIDGNAKPEEDHEWVGAVGVGLLPRAGSRRVRAEKTQAQEGRNHPDSTAPQRTSGSRHRRNSPPHLSRHPPLRPRPAFRTGARRPQSPHPRNRRRPCAQNPRLRRRLRRPAR